MCGKGPRRSRPELSWETRENARAPIWPTPSPCLGQEGLTCPGSGRNPSSPNTRTPSRGRREPRRSRASGSAPATGDTVVRGERGLAGQASRPAPRGPPTPAAGQPAARGRKAGAGRGLRWGRPARGLHVPPRPASQRVPRLGAGGENFLTESSVNEQGHPRGTGRGRTAGRRPADPRPSRSGPRPATRPVPPPCRRGSPCREIPLATTPPNSPNWLFHRVLVPEPPGPPRPTPRSGPRRARQKGRLAGARVPRPLPPTTRVKRSARRQEGAGSCGSSAQPGLAASPGVLGRRRPQATAPAAVAPPPPPGPRPPCACRTGLPRRGCARTRPRPRTRRRGAPPPGRACAPGAPRASCSW
uniref:Uncharacterized protein n=1 Tax=Mustela putorius furo TaxID=9669 RepID=M3Z864_MUSPF